MGKVTYSPGIQYVKGSLSKPKKVDGHSHGDYLIGTHREAATTNPNCTRLYIRKADAYQRSTPITADEQLARARFISVQAAVRTRMKNLSTLTEDQEAFEEQKNLSTGKKTFKAYLWSVCGAEYDAQH
jgi:hypothetical protein